MTKNTIILLAVVPALHAGTPEPAPILPPAPVETWIKPLIDIRARYEHADIDAHGIDSSNAFTVRERLGLETKPWSGFSALIEGEFSQAVVDNYHGGALGADPFDPSRSLIADPETNELNQAYLQYSGYDTIARIGRQRIIYDNAAFIGNVGWRQNEQTYDAISLSGKWIDALIVNYAYLNQVNRIFGSEAIAPNISYVGADTHLLNLSYTGFEGFKLGAYAYLMEFDDKPNWDNNTFGVSATAKLGGIDLYGEVAWQDEAGFASDKDAFYAHGIATKAFGTQSLAIGVETFGAGFKTPLATLHAFNGFADVFLPGRSEGTNNGLTDTYLTHSLPIFWDMKWSNSLHAFGDNTISTGYGWEFYSVLVKKFNDNFTAIAKYALFDSEGDPYVGTRGLPDVSRFSVQIDYKF